jgi:hypothetical protein
VCQSMSCYLDDMVVRGIKFLLLFRPMYLLYHGPGWPLFIEQNCNLGKLPLFIYVCRCVSVKKISSVLAHRSMKPNILHTGIVSRQFG